MIEGKAICTEDIKLYVWDGGMGSKLITKGEELDISYHEHTGALGLESDGVEYICSPDERTCFEITWGVV